MSEVYYVGTGVPVIALRRTYTPTQRGNMQAVKVGWAWKTFALASAHESAKKKPRSRKTKEERKALVESFITTYRSSNNGNFPSLNLTQKEVGGSFYTVREIMKEIMQEHETSGTSISALEDLEVLNRSPSQEEELNLATLSSADIHGIGNEQGFLVPDNSYQKIQTHARSSELSASSRSQEEGGEIEKSFQLDASLSNSEGYISIELGPASDHKEQLPLCVGEFIENNDEADKSVVLVEAADTEEVEVEKVESLSLTVVDDDECVNLLSSNENPDPLLSSHDNKWGPEADEDAKEGQKLLDSQTVTQLNSEIPKEAHASVRSNSILEQFEESCVGELGTSDMIAQTEGQAENFDDNKNPNLEYDSSYSSGVGDNPSEDGTLNDVLTVPVHVSAASAAKLDGFPDGASVGTEELIAQSVASVPVDVPTNDEIYSTETISLPSNFCKKMRIFKLLLVAMMAHHLKMWMILCLFQRSSRKLELATA